MKLCVTNALNNDQCIIEIGDKIGEGSNSFIYDVVRFDGSDEELIGKISKNNMNYVSFNLQYNSFLASEILNDEEIIVPHIYLYGNSHDMGDVLVMQKIKNIYSLNFIISNSFYYGEVIVKKVAGAIAQLHNLGISGYDIEFFWKADTNQLVMLDVGPQFTFDIDSTEMLRHHLDIEKNNPMGQWNIISQIIPRELAKEVFGEIGKYEDIEVLRYIDTNSVKKHIENVAKIHALSVISLLTIQNRLQYLEIFISEYKKRRNRLSFDSAVYLKAIGDTVRNGELFAEANLYYPLFETLCRESCTARIER